MRVLFTKDICGKPLVKTKQNKDTFDCKPQGQLTNVILTPKSILD